MRRCSGRIAVVFALSVALPLPGCGEPAAVDNGPAGSQRCASCHDQIFQLWSTSHHALAERPVDLDLDAQAFEGRKPITHGSLESLVYRRGDELIIETLGAGGVVEPYVVKRVIGVAPIRQYIVRPFAAADGPEQVAALSYDPARDEWFDVFGEEDRKPHEWGFWANRGMNWNSMCADCHNTGLSKNHEPTTDRYATAMDEMGVGCEACHGPGLSHASWQEQRSGEAGDPFLAGLALDRPERSSEVETCAACHSRRAELLERPGAHGALLDGFLPELPGLGEAFHADGQVHEEDYEYAPFLLSRMGHRGVRCSDCHEPHGAGLLRQGNALCLHCHAGSGMPGATQIDPAAHSRHDPAGPGGACVECHMPLSTFMQRHPRRDHGFTLPDPLLTRELGVPNACNSCHADRDVDWAVAAFDDWFRTEKVLPQRRRAAHVAAARRGDAVDLAGLIAFFRAEEHPGWRAVGASLLGAFAEHEQARRAVASFLRDPAPLVRMAAARALPVAVLETRAALEQLLDDPLRAVRVTAAWTTRASLDLTRQAGQDLLTYLQHNADQPAGAMMLGTLWFDRGDPRAAVPLFENAARWEVNSPVPQRALGLAWSSAGDPRRALRHMEEACRLAPGDAELWFSLGLARAEAGQEQEALSALTQACELDPDFIRAHYNLGLLASSQGDAVTGIAALERACRLEPDSGDLWFALATVRRDAGDTVGAIQAAERAAGTRPPHPSAAALIQSLRSPPGAGGR